VRHGDGTAFSFESTRFTDKYMRFVVPPRIRKDDEVFLVWRQGIEEIASLYKKIAPELIDESDEGTLKRKRAKEAARSVLPNALGSDGMVSMNARSLRWITELRSDEHADLSIREFAYEVFLAAQPWLPAILADAWGVRAAEGVPQIKYTTSKV
jgi:thymidylate synthase (FAD)